MSKRLSLLFLILLPVLCAAQKTDIRVDGQNIYNTIAYMASDQFMGRRTNTPELHRLQEWIVDQYREWGLEPAGEDGAYYQSVPISRTYANTYGIPELIVGGREFYARYEDFEIDIRSTEDLTVSSEICFMGYGISAPGKGLDEYAGLDVAGKIVFVLKGDPTEFIPPRPRLSNNEGDETDADAKPDSVADWEVESTDSTKIMTAYEKGAAGIILYDPEETADPFRRYRQRIEASPFEREFMVVSRVSEAVFHWILWTDPQMTDRGFRTWFDEVRKDLKFNQPRSFNTGMQAEITGFEKVLRRGKAFGSDTGRNVIAKISGTDPALRDQYIVIGAHLDHVGVSAGQIFNGAEDNASGSAVVFELARLTRQAGIEPKRTIIFCLWTGEELGLFGSEYWVENPTDGVSMDRVAYYFNLDMVGIGEKLGAPGALNFPSLWEIVTRDQDEDILAVVEPEPGELGGSDQTPFMELGVGALALMTDAQEGHPDYHDTADDFDKMDPEILRKTGQFVLQGALNLANESATDLIIPDRQIIFNGMYWPITIINPALKAKGGWTWLDAGDQNELADLVAREVRDLKDPKLSNDLRRVMRRRYGSTTRNQGMNGTGVISGDLALMRIAKDVLNFGRLDQAGDDSIWFDNGITEAGTKALKMMGKSNIALHLIRPGSGTVAAVLQKSKEPVLISGFQAFDDSMFALIKDKGSLIAVDLDPKDVSACLDRLEFYRSKLDTTSNLVVNVVSQEGLDEAKLALYRGLIEKGWTKDEIFAIGGEGKSWRSNGNFDSLPGGRPRFPGR